MENSRALHAADRAEDAIGALVRGYLRLALEAPDLLAVAVTEGPTSPAACSNGWSACAPTSPSGRAGSSSPRPGLSD